jgi:hypothetical protein
MRQRLIINRAKSAASCKWHLQPARALYVACTQGGLGAADGDRHIVYVPRSQNLWHLMHASGIESVLLFVWTLASLPSWHPVSR